VRCGLLNNLDKALVFLVVRHEAGWTTVYYIHVEHNEQIQQVRERQQRPAQVVIKQALYKFLLTSLKWCMPNRLGSECQHGSVHHLASVKKL
jgi:hypothetical protein